jgi:hypothetical protein
MPSTRIEGLPNELAQSLRGADNIVRSYLDCLGFIVKDTARDETLWNNHLLSYLAQDFLESAVSIASLSREGMLSVAKREFRFIVESSIKVCFVQQKEASASVKDKLNQFDKELSSERISIKQNLDLSMLPEALKEPFVEETGRVYGLTSNYVHLTPKQIRERIEAVDAGRTAGNEIAADVDGLNSLVSRGMAVSLVLLFHSVPDDVAGDWLVQDDGSTRRWYFEASRFLAGIDSHFDYKHERQERKAEIQAARNAAIKF